MAIVAPEKMDFSNKNIIMIMYGLPGTGKTTLALSAPDVLLIDTDEGMCRIKNEHRKDASICKTYEEILADVKEAKGKYKTIVIDTAGALIDMLKDWAMRTEPSANKKNGGFSLQGYGVIKQEFLRFSNELRKDFNVVYVFHASMQKNNEDIFYSLIADGSTKELVWQPADIGAFCFIQNGKRYLGFTPTEQYSAKSAYGIKGIIEVPELADGEPNDFLFKLFGTIRKNLGKQKVDNEATNKAYEEIMTVGKTLIDSVNNPETANECIETLKGLKHTSTTEKELNSLFKTKVKELGLTFNKTEKRFE